MLQFHWKTFLRHPFLILIKSFQFLDPFRILNQQKQTKTAVLVGAFIYCFFFRLGLLITIFLVVINLFNSAKYNLPYSETPNFIMIWIIICLLFILATFLQTTIMFTLLRFNIFTKDIVENLDKPNTEEIEEAWVKTIDIYSLILLAISFFAFNLYFYIFGLLF